MRRLRPSGLGKQGKSLTMRPSIIHSSSTWSLVQAATNLRNGKRDKTRICRLLAPHSMLCLQLKAPKSRMARVQTRMSDKTHIRRQFPVSHPTLASVRIVRRIQNSESAKTHIRRRLKALQTNPSRSLSQITKRDSLPTRRP